MSFAPTSPAAARERPEIRLAENLILVPDAKSPTVTGWMIVGAGCVQEENFDCRGIAHYLEHLLFLGRGSAHRPTSVAIFPGGSGNGSTSHRATWYWQRFPVSGDTAADLDKLFAYFAGSMRMPTVEPAAAERERNVVLQEYRLNTEAVPTRKFSNRLLAELFSGEPLGQPVIGTPDTIAQFSVAAATAFHARWYKPDNVTFIVQGPVDPATVRAAFRAHIMPLGEGGTFYEVPAPRSRAPVAKSFTMHDPAVRTTSVNVERLHFYENYDNGRLNWARNLLAEYLASQLPGSPRAVLLDDKNLVIESATRLTRSGPGALHLSLSVTPAEGVAAQTIETEFQVYLDDLARRGLGDDVIDRLRKRILVRLKAIDADPAKLGQSLVAWYTSRNSYDGWLRREYELARVTRDDVQHLLDALVRPSRTVVGTLAPANTETTP